MNNIYSAEVFQHTLEHFACRPQTLPFYDAWIPSTPTVFMSGVAVYAVHRLTKIRDREKLLDDFHSKIENAADAVIEVAYQAWVLGPGDERIRQISLVKSRIQKLASLINRLEIISSRRRIRWRIKSFGIPNVEIKMGKEMMEFRQTITSDPFEIPDRAADSSSAINCEAAKSIFMLSLDLKYRNWYSPI